MSKVYKVRITEEAYTVMKQKIKEDPTIGGRGATGFFDKLFLGHFTTGGKGSNRWKNHTPKSDQAKGE